MSLVKTNTNPGYAVKQPGLYEQVVDSILKDPRYKGTTKEQIDEYMGRVKWHESSGRNINQIGGGPASGYYQIEKNSMPYAYKGINKILGFKPGDKQVQWYEDIKQADENTQAAYSLAHDWMQSEGDKKPIDFSKPMDAWLDYHWRGKEKDRQARINSWNSKMKSYKGVAAPVKVDINPVQTGGLLPKPLVAVSTPKETKPATTLVKTSDNSLLRSLYAGLAETSEFIDMGLSLMAPSK